MGNRKYFSPLILYNVQCKVTHDTQSPPWAVFRVTPDEDGEMGNQNKRLQGPGSAWLLLVLLVLGRKRAGGCLLQFSSSISSPSSDVKHRYWGVG